MSLEDQVTLRAVKWVAATGNQTFLYTDGDWFGTSNSAKVQDPGASMDSKFLFTFQGCGSTSNGKINYGDRINIKSADNGYIQCGGGTCDAKNAASCNQNYWQVFYIESTTGKTGAVVIGDIVKIKQETGDKCSILAADNSHVFCGSTSNNNEYIQILPRNGTMGETAAASQAEYDKNRDQLLKEQDPAQYNAVKFLDGLTNPYYIAAAISLISCCCCMIIILIVLVKFM